MMNSLKVPAITLVVLLLATNALAYDHPLVPHEAEYRIKISLLRGLLTTRVEARDTGYLAQSKITPTGLASVLKSGTISEQSEFVLTPDGIRPRHYESVDTLSKRDKVMSFDFDWPAGTVSGAINDDNYSFDLEGMVHDRVSIQYELMHELLHGGGAGSYAMLDGDEIKELTVTNTGMQKVEVPFGDFEAIGIQHQAKNSSRVTTLWCVPELNYLPVIIEQHRKGKLRVRAVLTNYVPIVDAEQPSSVEPMPTAE